MNFLAHLHLADGDDDLLVGGLLGDFIKGRLEGLPVSPGLRAGVDLHRRIDRYTDGHPLVARSRERLAARHRRLSGIAVDLIYDHFLARHWAGFSQEALEVFTARAYRVLLRRRRELPPKLQLLLPRMAAQDWLGSYATLDSTLHALDRLTRRLRRGDKLAEGLDAALREAYAGIQTDFLAFFPELAAHVAEARGCRGAAGGLRTWPDSPTWAG